MRIVVPPGEVISNAAWPSHCTPMLLRAVARATCADAGRARAAAASVAARARRTTASGREGIIMELRSGAVGRETTAGGDCARFLLAHRQRSTSLQPFEHGGNESPERSVAHHQQDVAGPGAGQHALHEDVHLGGCVGLNAL